MICFIFYTVVVITDLYCVRDKVAFHRLVQKTEVF